MSDNPTNPEQEAEKAFEGWHDRHSRRALKNGWCIFQCADGYQLQGIDEDGVGDDEAFVRVNRGAAAGDKTCAAALEFLHKHAPEEHARVLKYKKEAEQDFAVVIIKPDAFIKGVYGEIFQRIFDLPDIELSACLMTRPGREFFEKFYGDKRSSAFFNDLCDFMSSGSVMLMLVTGEKVIDRLRKLVGATDSSKADPSTLRWRYGSHTVIRKNAVHCSANLEDAFREWKLVREEICDPDKPW